MPERKRRILVIDDDNTIATLLQPHFAQENFEAHIVTTGQEGLQDAFTTPPALVLLSAKLPDMAGLEVFKQLRARARTTHIPIMIVAGHSEARQQNELLAAGADDFIAKPFDLDILALRIRNTIRRTERDGLNNPRSGLPTGRLVTERIRALADEFGWYIIDFSIDNFDPFTNNYGFMAGEEVVAFVSNLLNEVVAEKGSPDDFIGHRDGADFVIVTKLAKGPELSALLSNRFNDEALNFYSFIEREQGYLEIPDENGGVVQRPLMKAKIKTVEGEPE
jgi:PleD family two-component response regulator